MSQNYNLIQDIQRLEETLMIAFLTIIAFLIIVIFRYWLKSKHKNIRYFILSILVIFFGNLVPAILEIILESLQVRFLFSSAGILILLISNYFLILFLESFKYENILTQKNITFGALVIMVVSVVITYFIMFFFLLQDGAIESSIGVNHGMSADLVEGLVIFMPISLFILLLTIGGMISILLFIGDRIRNLTNITMRKHYRIILISILFQFISVLLSIYIAFDPVGTVARSLTLVAQFLLLLSYIVIFATIYRGGVFMFQDETLRKLIVLDQNGISYYSYKFQRFEKKTNIENSDLMFSGALNAVGKIFGELTGDLQNLLKEMVLENIHLLIEPIPGTDLSALLIMDKSTLFYKEAIKNFAINFEEIGVKMEPNLHLRGNQAKKANLLVEQIFGFKQISS